MNNTYSDLPVVSSDGLYSHTSHHDGHTTTHQLPPPIYSTLAEERGATDEYTVITERDRLAGYGMIGDTTNVQDKEEAPAYYSTVAEGAVPSEYSVITEATNNTSNEGLVYSAVVVKDGKKTTVKTMATPQDEDTEQTPDTVQPTEGMVYSAVIRQDGKKTSVKITVE